VELPLPQEQVELPLRPEHQDQVELDLIQYLIQLVVEF
jgi:hypothetical protein